MDPYSILKVASMIATGAFGALGLFTKYKDDNEKITTAGKVALGGILISLSLSVLLYSLEASNARVAAEKAKAEANATANTLQSILANAKTTADQQRISLDETNRLKAGLEQTLEQQQSVLSGNQKILGGVTDTLQRQSELFRLNTGTLNQVSRSLYPLKNVAITYSIRVPMDHEQLKGYRERFEREVTSLLPSLNSPGIHTWMLDRDGSVMRFNLNSQSTLAPHHDSEQLAYELLLNSTIEVELYKTPIKPQDRLKLSRAREERINKPDLTLRVFGNLNSQTHLIDYTLESKQFAITSRERLADPFFWSPSGKIVGLTDLLGAQMFVLMPKYTGSEDEDFRESFNEIGRAFELQSLFINLSDGHGFVFMGPAYEGHVYGGSLEKHIGRDGYPVYSFTFPKTLEELRKIER
jgi:hypothetical protein